MIRFGIVLLWLAISDALSVSPLKTTTARMDSVNLSSTPTATIQFVQPDMTGIQEPACLDAGQRMQRVVVPVPAWIHPAENVGISYVHWPATSTPPIVEDPVNSNNSKLPPVVLVHGFDSSCLEYRRLGPALAARGIDAYAVDLLGWGFTQLDGVCDFSAQAKVTALESFIFTLVCANGCNVNGKNDGFYVAGASLGGAASIELASSWQDKNKCKGMILIDAQGFVDGIGPMASLPPFLAKLGVGVLKSNWLRSQANQMSYYNRDLYATGEAVDVGRLHCTQQELWPDAMVSFMRSGGFAPSTKIPLIRVPSLILWGRHDGILDGAEFAPKFLQALPNAQLRWIEECGHVPHLEQPWQTADAILRFVRSNTE